MAEMTVILAQILGGYMLVAGAAILIDRTLVNRLLISLQDNLAAIFIMGLIALLMGLTIAALHTRWDNPLAIIVTIIGWLAILEGALILCLQTRFIAVFTPWFTKTTVSLVWGAVAVVLGLVLLAGSFGYW
jgi:vacuolar-type H+-ATPase subunit I/STV1